ncbi:MAG: LptF/LptG family permease [Bacteroidota bacterium]
MKAIHRYVISSFIGPFIITFFISMFVLMMQFLWKWIDELIGKGLELSVIGELFFYVALTLVPLALPLTILLSSLMTFGSLGEHYELAALKSSGLSLYGIMRPLIFFVIAVSIGAFFFSNHVLPYANLKWRSLIFDVQHKKPAIAIKEGAFYNGINRYVIRVEKKDPDGKTLYGIMIYDHTQGFGNTRVVIAESGKMEMSEDGKYFLISLNQGFSYDEVIDQKSPNFPLIRTVFSHKTLRLNLTGFDLNRTDEDLFKSNYEMLNLKQIESELDTLELEKQQKLKFFREVFLVRPKATPRMQAPTAMGAFRPRNMNPAARDTAAPLTEKERQVKIYDASLNIARSNKARVESYIQDIQNIEDPATNLLIVWHKKFTLSIACLVFFFIGAPLGAIIRKGGLGMPVVISVLFFIVYWIISFSSEKMSKEGVMPPYIGMWISTLVLLPLGVFLTKKATADSALFDITEYTGWFTKFFRSRNEAAPTGQ